ncbi:MAG: zinc-binding dehydrogenase [Gaiellales bacterium]
MAGARDVQDLLRFVNQHELVPAVDRTFDLADIADAHAYLESGTQIGKVALRITQG